MVEKKQFAERVITDPRVVEGLLDAGFTVEAVRTEEQGECVVVHGTLVPPQPAVSFTVKADDVASLINFLTTPAAKGAPLILRHPDGTEEQTEIRVECDAFEVKS
jgi:hypothetical protein